MFPHIVSFYLHNKKEYHLHKQPNPSYNILEFHHRLMMELHSHYSRPLVPRKARILENLQDNIHTYLCIQVSLHYNSYKGIQKNLHHKHLGMSKLSDQTCHKYNIDNYCQKHYTKYHRHLDNKYTRQNNCQNRPR